MNSRFITRSIFKVAEPDYTSKEGYVWFREKCDTILKSFEKEDK